MKLLYGTATGCNGLLNMSVQQSHSASTSTGIVKCHTTNRDIGDAISINLGFTDDHGELFSGRVKMIQHDVPEDVYTLTCQDELIKAIDYFIVSNDPEVPYTWNHIAAEDLVWNVLSMANITEYEHQDTNFILGINANADVNLVSSYDYARMIGNIVTWSVWCDSSGVIQFRNRKPYPMHGTSGQPGDVADVPLSYTLNDTKTTNFSYRISEENLRNKVVLYGGSGVYAEASATSPYLPNLPGRPFYKAMAVGTELVDVQEYADAAVQYNLEMYNRLDRNATATVLGNHLLQARSVIHVDEAYSGVHENMYIFGANHSWSTSGYTVELTLKGE
jgi:hypothetical protein